MPDLRASPTHLADLTDHLNEFEGTASHFYCDHKDLVTVAVGYLVDKTRAEDDNVGRELAGILAERTDIRIEKRDGTRATKAEVVEDWQRVKDRGRIAVNVGARSYAAT